MKKAITVWSIVIMLMVSSCASQGYTNTEVKDIPVQEETITPQTNAENNNCIQTNETSAEYSENMYIGNKNSKKFHRPDCRTLPAEKNRIEFSSRQDAVNSGYSPCENCNP